MSKVIAWSKANWLILLMCVLILVGPTVGYVFASKLNKGIQSSREKEAKSDNDKLKRAEVTYSVGAIMPGEKALEVRRVPHTKLTEHFVQLRADRAAQVQKVVDRALERNQSGHTPVLEGLLPAPADRDQLMRLDMLERFVGDPPSKPSVLTVLLNDAEAGLPPDANEIATLLSEYEQGEIERHKAETGSADMDGEKKTELQESLVKRRIGEYQRRADEISIYADLDSLPSHFPRADAGEAPSIVSCFEWQWDYWIVQDVLEALKAANTVDGQLLHVPEAPVKRLLKMETTPLPGVFEDSYAINRNLTSTNLIATDPTFSITGRVTHDKNELYDVRPVTLSLVASSADLPALIEAISTTNFMTITDLDISEVEVWDDLSLGYYYGDDHVVKVDMQVETIWLRKWVVPYMPEVIRKRMSVQEGA